MSTLITNIFLFSLEPLFLIVRRLIVSDSGSAYLITLVYHLNPWIWDTSSVFLLFSNNHQQWFPCVCNFRYLTVQNISLRLFWNFKHYFPLIHTTFYLSEISKPNFFITITLCSRSGNITRILKFDHSLLIWGFWSPKKCQNLTICGPIWFNFWFTNLLFCMYRSGNIQLYSVKEFRFIQVY